MTPQEYISSGILETYALGSATPAEKQEVENMVLKYPEIKIALNEICVSLEIYSTMHAVEPDEKLRERIIENVLGGKKGDVKSTNGISKESKIIPLQPASSPWKTFAVAASIILLISVGINFYLMYKTNDLSSDNTNLVSHISSITDSTKQIAAAGQKTKLQRDSLLHVLDFVRNPMTQSVALNSIVKGHPMKAIVHWNMETKQVAVDPMTLPKTDANEKYVLWAIGSDQKINEGNFSVTDSTGIIMMKDVEGATAFAISLEKSGDVPAPAGPIYVLGQPASKEIFLPNP